MYYKIYSKLLPPRYKICSCVNSIICYAKIKKIISNSLASGPTGATIHVTCLNLYTR